MKPLQAFRQLTRELRGQGWRLAFFASCLGLGVAAVVAVAGLSTALQDGIRLKSRELLAADLAVEGYRPPPPELEEILREIPGLERTTVKEMVSMVSAPDSPRGEQSQLVEVKVAGPRYPFYGELETLPVRNPSTALGPEEVLVEPSLLERLGVASGNTLQIGGQPFRIAGEVLSEPDRIGGAMTLGPRILLSPAGLDRAGIETFGSRVRHRLLLRIPDQQGASAAGELAGSIREALEKAGVEPYYDVETWDEARPSLRRGIDRVHRFLGLLALVSLLIGGVGISQAVRAWLAQRLDAIAIRKCLGFRPREIVGIYLGQTALLGLAGSLAGALLGVGIAWALPRVMQDALPIPLEAIRVFQPLAIVRGLALGMAMAMLFGLPPLLAIRQISPARVLRRNAEPLEQGRWPYGVAAILLVAGVWATAFAQSGDLRLGSLFTLGLVVATLVLASTAYLAARTSGRLPRSRLPFDLRHGLTALGRPGAGTVGSVVALGIGVLVVLGTLLVERHLHRQLASDLPEEAPTAFMIEILPDQWPGIRKVLEDEGASQIDSVPVVTARMTSVAGREVSALAEDAKIEGNGDRRWALTREQRLTWMQELPEDNRIVEGELWQDDELDEVSVEVEFARELGAEIGSVLVFDVQGIPVELTVTSLRSVDWQTFAINFFFVVEPEALMNVPQIRLAAARLPEERELEIQNRLAADYPNVTLVRTREVLERIANVMKRLSVGVRFLGSFTVLAGLVILAGAVSAGSIRRGREVALLKTLGWTRLGVLRVLATEYALIGLLAGALGSVGATVLGYQVVRRGFEIEWVFEPWIQAVAVLATVLLVVLAGLFASFGALRRRPLEALRERN